VIPKDCPSVINKLWHAVPILKPLARVRKEFVNKVEAIVLNLDIQWISYIRMTPKLISEVITDVRPKGVP
jgi:hypothetical protein